MAKSNIKKIVAYTISFLSLFLCLYITIEIINANNDDRPPRIFGLSVSYVPTSSMEPTINAGDYVLFGSASFEDVDVNDIIVFYSETSDKYIIHRVIEKNDIEGFLITHGDNNPDGLNETVLKDKVYGKYIMELGILSIFSGGISKNLIFFILIIIFIIMIIMQIVSISIKKKTEDINRSIEEEKKLMLEELKKEILAEELAKMQAEIKELNSSDIEQEKASEETK